MTEELSLFPDLTPPAPAGGVVAPPRTYEPLSLPVNPLLRGTRLKGTIQEHFEEFHALNPWVYDSLVALSRDLVRRGRKKVGIGMLFEVLRWHYARTTFDPESDFKLNNNYRSRYARRIMILEPDLAGFFETRELKSE